MSAVGIQSRALLLDAYRELNSKKLFWITLLLSVLVVGTIGIFGINERGLTVLWWEFNLPLLNTKLIPKPLFYKFAFANVAVPIWLTWGASILALISVSSIFPDFLAGGAIELTLSKPVGRARLYLTKFFMGLLFVAMQVAAFAFTSFLVIGLRGGGWESRLFLAVPIVLLFFTYLFSVNALLGLLTRSTIAALLLTLLFWVMLFGLNTTDGIFIQQRVQAESALEKSQRRVERLERSARAAVEKAKEDGREILIDGKLPEGAADELEAALPLLKSARKDHASNQESQRDWQRYCDYIYLTKTFFPKTNETIGLLNRHLLGPEDRDRIAQFVRRGAENRGYDPDSDEPSRRGDPEAGLRADDAFRGRSQFWVMGTSAIFVVVMLGLGAFIFSRRDF